MHPQIIKCSIAVLNGFLKKNQGHLLHSKKNITYSRLQRMVILKKKQHMIFLQRKRQWNVTVYHDQWIKGVTAGGCGNAPYQGDLDK